MLGQSAILFRLPSGTMLGPPAFSDCKIFSFPFLLLGRRIAREPDQIAGAFNEATRFDGKEFFFFALHHFDHVELAVITVVVFTFHYDSP
jgi:hypothetical protein